ncbi:MAG: RCC1 domain-containing protein [Gemmatimonadaceae bacterium]
MRLYLRSLLDGVQLVARSARRQLVVSVARSSWRLFVVLLTLTACLPEATRPRAGVPTLDDAGSDGFVALSTGREHACALTADGTAYCWGSNEFGQLGVSEGETTCPRGDRDISCRTRATAVNTALKFRKVAAGGVHTCALALDDRVYCWGDNLRGALGDPVLRRSDVPAPVATTSLFIDVAAGSEHSCAVRLDGVGACWGHNDWGQVGVAGSLVNYSVPVAVGGTIRFASISASGERTCARALDGSGFCWGRSLSGLGGGPGTSPQLNPARVPGMLSFRSLEAGVNTTCGVTLANAAYCWEANSLGTIGDGTLVPSESPQLVSGPVTLVALRSGASHTCGIDDIGLAWCWGVGESGELGISPVFLRPQCGESRLLCATLPQRVSGWRQYSVIATGQGSFSCALTVRGNVFCWGAGDMGQRGDGRFSSGEWSPVKVATP